MKSITEFQSFTLNNGLKTKAALTAEGKSPEEIQAGLGESFKFEGDKLKHFINALEVAGQNQKDLKRVIVMSLNEGESAPQKAVKVEETHYVPEFLTTGKPASTEKSDSRGGNRGGGKGKGGGRGGGGEKSSPWGLSPEQKAAKNSKAPATKPS